MQRTPPLDTPTSPLVDGDWLEANLGHPRLRVLDARGRHPSSALPHAKRAEYEWAHVPGAAFVDWTRDFVHRDDPVPFQLADPEDFALDAGALGIEGDEVVVSYDDYYGIHAARVAWALRCHGVDAKVLDGGWRTWSEEGRPLSDSPTAPGRVTFPVRTPTSLRLTLDDLQRAREDGAVVVDARPRHLYIGEPGAPATGHIPGALALSYQELVDGATGLFQSPDAIRRLAISAGIDPGRPPSSVITTCGIGVSATVAMIALELVGLSVRGVYDGAWSEWSANPALPVAYGAG